MTAHSIALSALLTLALGCAREVETPAASPPRPAPAAPHHVHGAAPSAAATGPGAAPAVERRRAWPLLEAWLAGAAVDREPHQCAAAPEPELATLGAALFGVYCANCHGETGRGDGPRSAVFTPPPRDLARGVFKFRSTPSGTAPTPEDLFRTVSGGLRGTGMMAFADLTEQERWALVAYVRSLSRTSAESAPAVPVDVPPPPADVGRPARRLRGARAWTALGCSQCHGERGRGDGPAARELRDDLGRAIPPPDLVTRPLKRGDGAADLYQTLATGLDGTPMPSYAAVDPAALWDAVALVRSLRARATPLDARDAEEARALVAAQHQQGAHAVIGGCGCKAGGT
ncbi:MAG: cytochrome c [Myxococcota bacterium]